ncbi:hypothetical protein EYF80_050657 [Liparis tanakae]|uniref:Uncharacterized protein n=1 Tax=Liparis tanakae TaxID=230148 RepID=A0A4Z2FDF6_9TELE|nr:hypothetical protein EYF80_050657 [Liparis tanakae]
MLSLRGVRPVSSEWRSYCLVCRNLASVPWSRSKKPKTPKHWLNLEAGNDPIIYVDSPEVVEVVELGGGEEGQVVAAVGDGGADQSQGVPHAGGGQVGAQDHRPQSHRQHVGAVEQPDGKKRRKKRKMISSKMVKKASSSRARWKVGSSGSQGSPHRVIR